MKIYPNRIRELRNQMGLSQTELAERIGIKQPTVNRHEQGNRNLDAFAISQYSRFFGVSPYELFVPDGHELEYAVDPELVTNAH